MSVLKKIIGETFGLLDLFLPPACPLCDQELKSTRPDFFCPACLAGFHPLSSPGCPRCALPYPANEGADHLCEECIRHSPCFDRVTAAAIYEGNLRLAVHQFKYQGTIGLDRPLGILLAETLESSPGHFIPDLIIPVPLHPTRLRERTYNQSLLLAGILGRRWRVPVASRLLIRVRPTPPQQGLKRTVRRKNLKDAFALRAGLPGRRVLLVDDVLTTGATVRECSKVLMAGGAERVGVAVLGRARRHPL